MELEGTPPPTTETQPQPPPPQDLVRGSSGPDVTALQNFLFQEGYRISEKEQADKSFGDTTYDALVDYQKKHKLVPNGIYEGKARWVLDDDHQHPNKFIVMGQVLNANGTAKTDVVVKAYDKDIRSEQELDVDSNPKANGEYLIMYRAEKFAGLEKGRADLFVKVFDKNGVLLATSPIIFNAGKVELVNFTIGSGRGLSEFEKIVNDITPLIDKVVPQASLTSDDISFLNGETGIDAELLTLIAESARRQVQANPIVQIAQSVFYGLFRQNFPIVLQELMQNEVSLLRAALEQSSNQGIIPQLSATELDQIAEKLGTLKASLILQSGPAGETPSLGDLLGTSPLLTPDKKRTVAGMIVQHGGTNKSFWDDVDATTSLNPTDKNDVRFTLHAGDLTTNHLPLVKELRKAYDFTVGTLPSTALVLRRFAARDAADWKTILEANSSAIGAPPSTPGATPAEKIVNYAAALNAYIENALPTPAIAGRVDKDANPDNPFNPVKVDLKAFFDHNQSYEFREIPIDVYMSTPAASFEGVNNRAALVTELKNMQRLFNVVPRYTQIRSLRKDDLHSAFSMVKLGERRFVEKYSAVLGGETAAQETYRKAKQTHATAMNFYLGQAAASNAAAPAVVSNGNGKQAIAKFAGVASTSPDLPTLFGSLELCECEQCQSVYSPAAYFVDILKFLGDGPKKNNLTPLQVLIGRRPDLEHIELTCENTTTQVPYVDLTREIMEAAVKARSFKITEDSGGDISNISAVLADLNNEKMPQSLPAIFKNKGYSITDKASIRKDDDQTNAWLILDTSWSFTVKYLGAGLGFDVMAWPQTSWTSDELRANPEHVNNAAYTELRKAVYWWSLPLNVPVEEIRGYLGHFDVKRTEVMETFFRDPAANATALMDKSVANEYIGLSTEESKIITGTTTGGPDDGDPTTTNGAWDFWGLKPGGNSIDDPTDGSADPAVGTWDEVLKRVSIFLQQSGLAYREMLEVLGCYFINPAISSGRKLGIVSTDTDDATTCNLSKLEIRVVDPQVTDDAARKAILIATWNKIHRFVRLARKLGWTMRDLDKAIIALQPKTAGQLDITADFLVQLSHIQRLSAQFDLPVVNLLCFWAPMDTGRYLDHFIEGEPAVPSLYATLFNNRAAAGQSLAEDPLTLTGKLSENKSRISAALQVSIDDLALMLADVNVVSDDDLSLTNLSDLYSHATFARALNYSMPTYIAALRLINSNPFLTTEETMKFVQDSERIAAAGFSVEDLSYLLRHDFSTALPLAIGETAIAAVLETIRAEVQKVAADNNFVAVSSGGTPATSDPNGDLTRRKLASLNWDTAIVEQLIAALNSTSPEAADIAMVKRHARRFSVPRFDVVLDPLPAEVVFTGELKNKIYYDNANDKLHFTGVMTEAERNALLALSTNTTYKQAINNLFAAPDNNPPTGSDVFITSSEADTMFAAGSTPAARFVFVLSKLLPYLRNTLSERIVIQLIGEYLKFDSSSARELLTNWVKSTVTGSTDKAISVFLDPAFAGSNPNVEVTRDAFPVPFNMVVRLFKIATLNIKFKLTSQQLQWLFDFGPSSGWLDMNKLPFDRAPLVSLYRGWARLADLFQLSASLPLSDSVLTEVFTAARIANNTDVNPLLQTLSEGFSWKLENLTALSNGFGFQVSNYKDEQALRRLNTAFKLMSQLGASGDQCLSWTPLTVAEADEQKCANDLKALVRATLTDTQWLEKAKTLNDPLREKQRAGLVSYLMLRRSARNADELYDDFLVDVEMSPCMMTTRIKQAIGSIQLFIQRSLMNLEDQVALTPKEAREWSEWRKQYRVWEANRKILLYPENWIEPELRDGKSVFFEELENELLQSEVTMDTAETALQHYLEKLHEVARLEIVGMYHEKEVGANDVVEFDVMHVVGRTFSSPHVHFYRRQIDSASWTAWEKVEADIQGDHLIPVIWNRGLYLFWPVFTVKPQEKEIKVPAPGATMEKGEKVLEIQLAWTEYKNGKWSAKKLASPFRSTLKHPEDGLSEADFKLFSFKSRVQTTPTGDEQLFIDFYGPVEKLNTVTITANDPRPKQETLLFSLGAGKTKNVFASVNNQPFQAGDASLVEIIARDSNNQAVGVPIALSNTGTKEIKNTTTAALKYFLLSADYKPQGITNTGQKQVCWIVERNQQPLLVGGNGNSPQIASLALETAAPAALLGGNSITPLAGSMVLPGETQVCEIITEAECTFDLVTIPTTTTSTTFTTTSVDPTQAIASFYFDDGQQSVMALFDSNAISRIESVVGTRFQNMMMVEFENQASDGLTETNILKKTPGTFRLLPMHQSYQAKKLEYPAFFQDDARSYFMTHDDVAGRVRFSTFYHPTIPAFFKSLNHDGVRGLMSLTNQRLIDSTIVFDDYSADPAQVDITAKPREDVDFAYNGAYAVYNWELFFHTPFLIATQLTRNQRFEEAQKWFHYIFDPTATDSPGKVGTPGPERFWRVKPLYEQALKGTQTLEDLFEDDALEAQISEWQANPFKPHVIARLRLVTYMKAVVMRYIDNLIAWGDQLFRRDSIESINEATQLYILAAQILGRRPEQIPARAKAKVQTFRSLNDHDDLNGLANASVEIEGFLSPSVVPPADGAAEGMPLMPFFGIPGNDKLLGYWTTVADRLFKIRHCQNIDGIVRTLPTFDSPIDPALLVKAAGVGVDVASALSDINVALPHYRFNVMSQKASELCGEVKSLGGALLAALEKRDAEELALLRSTHEMKVLKAARAVKEKQLQEATIAREGLDRTKELTTIRRDYYRDISFMNPWEITQVSLTGATMGLQAMEVAMLGLAGTLHLIPNVKVGVPTSIGATYGGENVGNGCLTFCDSIGKVVSLMNTSASMAATMGGHYRRFDDWKLQERMANKELEQIEKQIAAADIRVAIAENELRNHDLQVENTNEVDEVMRSKFTNRELYDWMVGQISGIYFRSYQLAYDVAKRAECAYRYELGLKESSFIQFGYWDSLKKGLLAGERLSYDLKRMEIAYLDQNRREYEIVKHVSLQSIDPVSLLKLKQTGECFVTLPETLFDVDYSGHYMRRMKSVGITVPCVAGPYSGVNCTLTLMSSSIRHVNTLAGNKYARQTDDPRFADTAGTVQSIVTSSGQNDSGMFETNLHDERYLPFEGQGAISTWRIELPKTFKTFDYNTISDVVMHVRYTSREGGSQLRVQAEQELQTMLNDFARVEGKRGLTQMYSLRHEFGTEWSRFLGAVTGDKRSLTMPITKERFPFLFQGRNITIGEIELFVKTKSDTENTLKLTLAAGNSASGDPLPLQSWNGLVRGTKTINGLPGAFTLNAWRQINQHDEPLEADAIQDILVACRYTI